MIDDGLEPGHQAMDEVSDGRPIPVLLISAPDRRVAERRYILDVILREWLGLDYELRVQDAPVVSIRLANDPGAAELQLPDILFAIGDDDWLTVRSMPTQPLARLARSTIWPTTPTIDDVPVLFGTPGAETAWFRTADGLAGAIDIFGSAFFLLTRCEEVIQPVRDRHDRFPASESLAESEGFIERPLADEYVDLLWSALHALWPTLARRPTAFRLRLTHDVDQPWAALGKPARSVAHAVAGDLVRRREPLLAARRVRALLDAQTGRVDRDPLNTFDFLMDTSERHGLRSTFYFLAGGMPGEEDFRYRISDPAILQLLRRVHDRGHEIGLHASYISHRSEARTILEFEALRSASAALGFESSSWGVRQHYLRFDVPETWRIQAAAGFEHDSTVGFAERIGFRAGTCREYPVFDVVERRRLELRERPLVAMDVSLFEQMALGLDEAANRVRLVVDACRRHGGDAVILYHNNSVAGTRLHRHYRELIADLAGQASSG